MSAPTKPIAALDVQRRMSAQQAIATLLTARVSKPVDSESDRIAYADAAHLIETRATVATDADYAGWAEHIAALQAANHTARKEASR